MINDIAVSACIITKNSEQTILETLKSIENCYEIIITDTGSTDNTINVIKNFKHNNLKLFRKKFNRYFLNGLGFDKVFDFSAARNWTMNKSTGNWILIIDSDEVLDSYSKIEMLINKYADKNYAWRLRQITDLGEGQGRVKILTTRLWKNELGIHYKNIVHETPDLSVEKIGYEFATANDIYLYSKRNPEGKAERIIKALKHTKINYHYFYLASAYSNLNDINNCIINLNLSLENDKLPAALQAKVYSTLAHYYFLFSQNNYEKSVEFAKKSLEILPEQNTARLIMHYLNEFKGKSNGEFKFIETNNDFDLNN